PSTALASIRRAGSSCSMPEPRPRSATTSAPFLLREIAPAVLRPPYRIFARPVDGSSCMTLPASLFAKRIVPRSPAIGPSTLLPSHDQTTFHCWPAASTPAIACVAGSGGGGGAEASAAPAPGMANGCGGCWHVASTALYPAACHACWRLPRSNVADGPSTRAPVKPFARTSQLGFVQRSHDLPTNIRAAFRSRLNCHSSQPEATLAYSPPPG